MRKFKRGDRVKQIVEGCGFKSPYATVTEVDGDHIWHRHDGENQVLNCSPDWLELVEKETKMSKYHEIKERIKNVQGWDKEADDILNEIFEHCNRKYELVIFQLEDTSMQIGIYDAQRPKEWLYDFCRPTVKFDSQRDNQCEKLDAFKLALLWLLDHSDIKNEKQEKIEELRIKEGKLRAEYESKIVEVSTEIKRLENDSQSTWCD